MNIYAITLPPGQKSIALLKSFPRLLVVDNEPIFTRTLLEIFHADHDVFVAGNGVQALEICSRSLPDLILLDIALPEMDGIEGCRRLKRNSPWIKGEFRC